MDINEPSESDESNDSQHSLSYATSSTIFQSPIFHNGDSNKIKKEKDIFNNFISFCETNMFNNALEYDNDITENATSEEDIIEQCLNENIEKPLNEIDVTEKPTNANMFKNNPLNKNNSSEKAVIENDFLENALLNEIDSIEKSTNEDFIANTIDENNFIKKLMTEDDFIEKFLEKTTEKNSMANANPTKKFTKANPVHINITNVNPKMASVGKEKTKSTKTITTKVKNEDEKKIEQKEDPFCFECTNSAEPVAHIKLEVLDKLKLSTRKLIKLLEEIQLKTHADTVTNLSLENQDLEDIIRSMPNDTAIPSAVDIAVNRELKKLQQHTKSLDAIHIENEKDDCSVYKRLTRKCVCMNRVDYNDFIIHFNEDSKFFTSNTGEIIKNVRILKKFLYFGGEYCKRAFMFLNEGLSSSNQIEKIEIIQGCSHADVCNIFEEYSMVVTFISWPCKSQNYGDSLTQSLAALILLKMAQIEEGRRYLNYTSKISNDIKKVIRKKSSFLSFEVIESLNSILNLLQPPMVEHISSVTYYCKAVEEGFGFKTVTALARYRHYLTLEEVFIHLDLIHNLSKTDCGKNELRKMLPIILSVFRNLLFEFDNSEINIILTNILNNIISRNILSQNPLNSPYSQKRIAMAETTTDAIEMKTESNQIPTKKIKSKNGSMSKGFFISTSKHIEPSRRKIWEISTKPPLPSSRQFNSSLRLKKNTKVSRSPVIVVPIDKEKKRLWV